MNVNNLKNTAKRLIEENGFPVTIISVDKGEFNPETGEYEKTTIDFLTNGIYVNNELNKFENKQYITEDTQSVILIVCDFEIDPNDLVYVPFENKKYKIKSIKKTYAGPIVVIYKLFIGE
jgi:hypothetical protein